MIAGASFVGDVSFPDPGGIHRAVVVLSDTGRLQLWSVASGTAARLAEYDPTGAGLTEIDPVIDASGATRSLLVARDDGYRRARWSRRSTQRSPSIAVQCSSTMR